MSVRLSVKHVNCDKTKESYAHILYHFPPRRMVGKGRSLLLEILGQTDLLTHPLHSKTLIFSRFSLR